MLNQNFVWLGLAITTFGNLFYMRDAFKGESQPNRVTFFLWGAVPLIAFFSQKNGGGGKQILYTLIVSLMPFLILMASFMNKKAYWKITKFDVTCGLISIAALVVLLTTNKPTLALIFSLAADFFAALPTLIKSYKFPLSETRAAYASELVSSLIVVLTIHKWIASNYLFAAYILIMNLLFTSLLTFSPKRHA